MAHGGAVQKLESFGKWQMKKELGSGGFGEVHYWLNAETKEEIATKRLKDNRNLPKDEEKKLKERWQQEYEYTLNLTTEYIVRGVKLQDSKFLNYLNESHGGWRPLPVIVMEYCNGGDLRSQLQQIENTNGLVEFEICEILKSLRHAVEYLHNQCNIKHRDLKPDNIVIKQLDNGSRIYKLTDFGFARSCCENTVLQSVVGTRNYFAPEVVDTAKYTKTVDYWSMGVIAFELLTGILPFIPHQSLFNIIVNIKKKPRDCVAITQTQDEKTNATFQFHDRIFPENRVSRIFSSKIEKWLRLALDQNYSTRGTVPLNPSCADQANGSQRIPKFYDELDTALNTKILTVFCLNTCKFYDYEVKETLDFKSFLCTLEMDTEIPVKTLYCILPTGHPRSIFDKTVQKPLDIFVDGWQNPCNEGNPAVMLYISGYESEFKINDPHVSEVIKLGLKSKTLPMWLQQDFARHLHFLVANEQRHLEALVSGLQEYALTLEHEIHYYEQDVSLLIKEIHIIRGRVEQFVSTVQKAKDKMNFDQAETFSQWTKKALHHTAGINQVENEVGPALKHRYNSALRRIKEHASNNEWKELSKCDFYKLTDLRKHLKNCHRYVKPEDWMEKGPLCATCEAKVYSCLDERNKWLQNKTINLSKKQISEINIEFRKIKSAVISARQFLKDKAEKLETDTDDFCKFTCEMRYRVHQNGSQLNADGSLPTVIDDCDLSSLNDIVNADPYSLIKLVNDSLDSLL